ncbi:cAMP-dependent protein kinase catalytic subunit beta-like isoform X2 [Cylas formicarius]|uniref:cAMP-dependent protein kinase catalytic subunit beta-like isoform X2 n=1 Tax=Cylas formicarius TaxID=197179 RepID=UPI0029585625|nr:cAMP-dependent protein kinase catalytic subunit beta-like isoform X2 [Cylas formicarius]
MSVPKGSRDMRKTKERLSSAARAYKADKTSSRMPTEVREMVKGSSAYQRGRTRGGYGETLEKLRKEFYEKWDENKSSGSEGLKDFERIKTLGSGSFGRVFLVQQKTTNNYYAMKVMDKSRIVKLKQVEHTLYEKKILESARFPFLISLEFAFKDNSYIYLLMPFINGGEMFTHLRRVHKFDETLSKFYAAQVLLALEFLHYCDVLYRDLKPENILIDAKGYLKIADMGFCKIVKSRTWTLCGTPEYIAPEIILSKGYGKAVDWWSYGVLLFEMTAGFPPFTSNDPMRVYEKIIACKYKCPGFFTLELTDLVRNLLQVDLTRRYGNLRGGTADIKTHRWFQHTNFEGIFNKQIDPPFKPKTKNLSDTTNFDDYPETDLRVSEHNLFIDQFEKF